VSKVVCLPVADDPALRAIARLQRLAHCLEQAGARSSISRPPSPVPPLASMSSAVPGDMPTFAEMMAVVERRGRGRRRVR